ncbi:hypothetical protein DFP72DRAFT_852613 [Ephemerocybe angulata]|uniref:Uncharacterized protein n=1 Tax=Ephemerocybe angulata TaxID=980116 RepID=A0A8H6M165_9AGAR|nr:hypothetical protein DFP72DRAFT_852613 [Tulosesus angulatus]
MDPNIWKDMGLSESAFPSFQGHANLIFAEDEMVESDRDSFFPAPNSNETKTSLEELNSRLKMVAESGAFDNLSDRDSDTLPTSSNAKGKAPLDEWSDDPVLNFTVPQLGKVRPSYGGLGLPPSVPQSWIDAFNPHSDSSMVTTEILNLHIQHLRWTYRCLLAHYAHCDKIKVMLHTQGASCSRALTLKMSGECLASLAHSSAASHI